MEITQLQAVVMIHREGTFTKAAERLHISQPALSQQIKGLEQEIGAAIFERRGRQIRWTPVGEVTLTHANHVLAQLNQLHVEIADLLDVRSGQLRIGTSDTICLYLLPQVIQRFSECYPQIDLHLMNRPSHEIVTLLQEGAIDFGIVTLPVQQQGIETSYLCDRQDVAVCAPTHQLAQQHNGVERLSLADLQQYQLLLLERGTTSRAFLDQLFGQAGLTPAAMELGSIEVLKQYAAINLGVAIVPQMAVRFEEENGKLIVFQLPWVPPRAIGVVQRRHGYHSPAAMAFLDLLVAMM